MKRFLLSAAALVIGLTVAATAEAGSKGGSSKGSSFKGSSFKSSNFKGNSFKSSSFKGSYQKKYGTSFKGGYFYKGKDHHHWTYRCWWGKYGCYTYYCPYTCCWYYWYPQDCCYYPCSYVSYATPACESAPVGVATGVQQVVNVTNNSPGGVPAGATPLPPPEK